MLHIQIVCEVVEMSAERGPNKHNSKREEDFPRVPLPAINWRYRRQREEHDEGIPLELPVYNPEEQYRTPETSHDQNRNPFEIDNNVGNYGRFDYSR
jgi:hypothetical protein